MKEHLAPGHRVKGDFILAPQTDIEKPADGRICKGGRWWLLTENNEVLFYKSYSSPQCNSNRAITAHLSHSALSKTACGPLSVVYLSVAFVPHRCEA